MFLNDSGQNILNDGDLRLVSNSGTTFGTSGRLEVYYSFQWGTVCIDFFGAEEALVACRQLGFTTYANYGSVGAFGYVPILHVIVIIIMNMRYNINLCL